MSCSPAEIERKRQEALQKLAKKGLSPMKNLNQNSLHHSPVLSTSSGTTESPRFDFKSKAFNTKNAHKKPYEKQAEKTTVDFYGKNKFITVTLSLISSNRFNATMSTYFLPVIDIFKLIPSKNYDPNTRIWSFQIKDYDSLVSKLITLKSQNVIIEKLPAFVINCLKNSINNCDVDFNRLDPELSESLFPFQIEGLRFGIERNGRCFIADDMGLGKTFQALAIMNYYRDDWPLLIVTTASMKNTWEETIFKYLPSVSCLQVQYMVSGKDYIGDSKILITSHDLMSRYYENLLEKGFGCMIIDESHTLKNFKAKMTQAATKLARKVKRIVLLSGTPALSRPSELYTQLSLIDEKFFGSFFEYATRYCNLQKTTFGYDSSGKSNLQELEIILARKFMIRRTKENVLGSLPKKTQEVIRLDVHLENFSERDRQSLKALATRYEAVKKASDKHTILLSFFAESAKIKIPSVCSYVLQVLEKKVKFLIFAHHLVMLDAIEEVLKRKNLKYIRIDGRTTGDQRKYFVDKFQSDTTYVCAILSITAANAGITLTAAELVIFAELHWNPSILSQAEARAHRIGQENPVVVQYLLAYDTADDSIWPMLQEKQKILSEVGLCKMSFDNVNFKKQDLAEGLSSELNFCNTTKLDIRSYFKSVEKSPKAACNSLDSSDDHLLDDGFDDILCNIDL